MSEYMGKRVPLDAPYGTEVRRWRVRYTQPPKRLRLLDRGGDWGVLAQIDLAELRVYPTRAQAEDVCQRLMRADGGDWREIPLPAGWWT